MVIISVLVIIGILAFTFAFWRRLREDYVVNQLFTTAFFSLFGLAGGYILAIRLFPVWWFWSSLVFSLFGLAGGILRFKLKMLETFEAYVLGLLYLFFVFLIYAFFRIDYFQAFIGMAVTAVVVCLFNLLDTRYRNFVWYKSGRVGFTGLTIFGLFFLVRALFAVTSPHVISLVGRVDAVISGVVSFLSFLAVFNLARKVS